jgi:hypothetical protein
MIEFWLNSIKSIIFSKIGKNSCNVSVSLRNLSEKSLPISRTSRIIFSESRGLLLIV